MSFSEKVPYIVIASFFIAIFLLFTGPIEDGDFFWHIRTGQWIWEHKTLPASDHFSYTAGASGGTNPFRLESKRIPFLLKQYWLGQLALLGAWNLFGGAGIVLLRAFSYTGILLFLLLWMKRSSSGAVPLFFLFLAGNVLRDFPSERPQLFTFTFFPFVIFLLERIRNSRGVFTEKTSFFLPVLMVVWANIHGGYLLGDGLILLCLMTHISMAFLKKHEINYGMVLLFLISIAISGVNPNGFLALTEFFKTAPSFADTIHENLPPFKAALRLHEYYPYYWTFLVICVLTVSIRIREMDIFHTLTLLSLAVLSLTGLRYMPFLLMACPLLINYVPEPKIQRFKWLIASLLLIIWISSADWKNRLKFGAAPTFPEKAVAFMKKEDLPRQLFNFYDWGGYLMYNLPEYKVFIDGRALVEEVSIFYDKVVWTDEWKRFFDFFGIKTVIMPKEGEITGRVRYPLLDHLYNDREWHLVYSDDVSVIFVKGDGPQSKGGMKNE